MHYFSFAAAVPLSLLWSPGWRYGDLPLWAHEAPWSCSPKMSNSFWKCSCFERQHIVHVSMCFSQVSVAAKTVRAPWAAASWKHHRQPPHLLRRHAHISLLTTVANPDQSARCSRTFCVTSSALLEEHLKCYFIFLTLDKMKGFFFS